MCLLKCCYVAAMKKKLKLQQVSQQGMDKSTFYRTSLSQNPEVTQSSTGDSHLQHFEIGENNSDSKALVTEDDTIGKFSFIPSDNTFRFSFDSGS